MINSAQNSGSAAAVLSSMNAGGGSAASASVVADTQDRFLKLLVTQMRNQDPLNPMDNAQVTSQMAQLSTVAGIDRMNVTLQALSDSMTSNQALQAAAMIGHGVLVPGNGVDVSHGKGYGCVELAQSADVVDVAVRDGNGVLVRTIHLGTQPPGMVNWQWDGRDESGATVADGSYTFTVNAMQAGKAVDATALQFGIVNSVTRGRDGVTLTVGQLDGIPLSQVRQIL